MTESELLRELPAVHEVLQRLAPSLARFPRALVLAEVRNAPEDIRAGIRAGSGGGLPA